MSEPCAVKVAEVMHTGAVSVAPDCPISEIETVFYKHGVSALPVMSDKGSLLGILSRLDIIRQICAERSISEVIAESDYDISGFCENPSEAETVNRIAELLGRRIEHLVAADVMTTTVISIESSEPLIRATQKMLAHGIHRLPVIDGDQLIGMLTSMDVVRYVSRLDRNAADPAPLSGDEE